MNNLLELHQQAKLFFNPMGIDNELSVMKNLQEISSPQIKKHKEIFFDILDILSESHIDDYFCVDGYNKIEFVNFIDWLKNLEINLSLKESEFIDSIIDVLYVG